MKKKIIILILIFLVIKLFIMPYTIHEDMLSSYTRSSKLVYNNEITFGITSFVPHIIQSGWLFIISPFFPEMQEFFDVNVNSLTNRPEVFEIMAQNENINLYLFLMKIPYLIFDLLIIILLLKFFPKKEEYVKYYLFFIPAIYASFMFGRYETISLFFLITTFLAAKKNPYLAILPFGLLLMTRIYFLILAPVYLLLLIKNKIKISKKGLISAGTISAILIIFLFNPVLRIINSQFARFFFTFIIHGIVFPIYPFIYISIITFILFNKKSEIWKEPFYKQFFIFSGITALSFFAICYWNIQYLAWITPFMVYYATKNKIINKIFFISLILFLPLLLINIHWNTTTMLTPINYNFFTNLGNVLFTTYEKPLFYTGLLSKGIMSILLSITILEILKMHKIFDYKKYLIKFFIPRNKFTNTFI